MQELNCRNKIFENMLNKFFVVSTLPVLVAGCSAQQEVNLGGSGSDESIPGGTVIPQLPVVELSTENPVTYKEGITIEIDQPSSVRYIVVEQLANKQVSSSAIGQTSAVTGGIELDSEGQPVQTNSLVTIDLTTLTSDKKKRHDYLKTRGDISSEQYPTATLVVDDINGLSWPLPKTGDVSFQLSGNLTVLGTTKHLTWDVVARMAENRLVGQASTDFTFDTFGIKKPNLFFIVSIENQIQVVIDFTASIKGS